MKKIITLSVYLIIGYGIGWYQFSGNESEIQRTQAEASQPKKTAYSGNTKLTNNKKNEYNEEKTSNDNDSHQFKDDGNKINSALEVASKVKGVSYTDISGLLLSPTIEKVSGIIDGMTDHELSIAIKSITSFTSDDMKGIGDLSTFSKRLLSIALLKNDTSAKSNNKEVKVFFGNEVNTSNKVTISKSRFKNYGKIYASFTLEENHESVFIKWIQVTPYSLKLFNKYPINKGTQSNYVWYEPTDWDAGLYMVEVYATDESLTKLASGTFKIVEE